MPTNAYAELTQRKIVTGTSPDLTFWVREFVGTSLGQLAKPFKVDSNTSGDIISVATLAETRALEYNPINHFSRGPAFTGVSAGDILEIFTPPAAWDELVGATTVRSVVSTLDGDLVLAQPFWTRESGLTWKLWRGGTLLDSGTSTGVTQRDLALGDGGFLDTQVQVPFVTSTEALTHIQFTATMMASLAKEIRLSQNEFLHAPNPITSTYLA